MKNKLNDEASRIWRYKETSSLKAKFDTTYTYPLVLALMFARTFY